MTDSELLTLAKSAVHRIEKQMGLSIPAEGLISDTCLLWTAIDTDKKRWLSKITHGVWSDEIERLIGENLTCSETYFFRGFTLRKTLLEQLIPTWIERENRQLNIWSAGCSTGEELYSLAMTFIQEGITPEEWNLNFLGTDINPHALNKAREGHYREWSFRETDPVLKQRYFTQQGKRWVINEKLRSITTFRHHNLASAEPPQPGVLFDLILCCNVLIYFSPDLIQKTATRLVDRLAPNGVLITTPYELHILRECPNLEVVHANEYIYVKKRRKKRSPPQPTPPKPPIPPVQAPPAKLEQDLTKLNQASTPQEARAICDELIDAHPLWHKPYYIKALLLEREGSHDEALNLVRHSVYLEPEYPLGHMLMANLLFSLGELDPALRGYQTAERLIDSTPDPDTEGVSVNDLKELIRQRVALAKDGA